MSDELESLLTESLRQRAMQVGVHRHGFGDVRRRVRRHRQRQMAAGLLPAVAGFGFIVTRQVAHDPLSPGEGASGCDTVPTWGGSSSVAPPPWTGEPTTLPMDAPYVTDVNGNVYYLDANGRPALDANGRPALDANGITDTTAVFNTLPPTTYTTDADGNVVDANSNAITAPNTTDANGNVLESSTTIACEVPTTVPPTTGPSDTTPPAAGDSTSTTSTNVAFADNSFVLFVNASTVNGAASAYAQQFPGAQRTTGATKVQNSYVMASVGSEGAAQSIANQLGVTDVRVGIDSTVILDQVGMTNVKVVDMSGITVVVVIGEGHALALTAPTTVAPESTTTTG